MESESESEPGIRVLVVSAGMGSGHSQIARELRRRLVAGGHRVVVADLLDLMPAPTGRWLAAIYRFLVGRAPWLYERVYSTFFLARQRSGERVALPVRLAERGLRRVVREFRPDVTVTTYHLAALAVGRLRAGGEPTGPVVTLITQFAVHDLWLHPAADLELTISERAAAEVRRRSGRAAVPVGPVVRPEFARGCPAGDVVAKRRELGLRPGDRAALVVTGSLGFAGGADRALAAVAARPGWTAVAVAGRNTGLQRRLSRSADAVVLGWVDDMAALMAACDVVVDNACGTTAKEALCLGVPVVTFRPIAGHGRDDAAALEALGLTDVVDDEPALAAALDRVTTDRAARRDRCERGKALFRVDAAEVLVRVARGGDRLSTHRLP